MRGGVRKRGTKWTAYWDLPPAAGGGRRQGTKAGFPTKKAAQEHLAAQLRALQTGDYVERDAATFGGWFDTWAVGARTRLKPTTLDKYTRDFARYVAPTLGTVRLQSLTAVQLDGLYARLLGDGGQGRPLSPTSVGHVHRLVHKMLADALRKGLVVRNVASAATPPKQLRPGDRPMAVWAPDQLARFLASVADDRHFALWRLFVLTGCRRGEAVGAHWADLDLDGGSWSIRWALVAVNGVRVATSPKSGRARVVALDAATVAALRTWRATQAAERLAWGPAWTDTGYVFTHEDGRPLHPNQISRRFVALGEAASLPRIRLHDLRHSAVTAMIAGGQPVLIVSERVGHASSTFTMDRYGHVTEAMDRAAATGLAALIDGTAR